MNERANPKIIPDFWLVRLDETKHWDFKGSAAAGKVKRVWATYLIDVTEHTYACEMPPSYWCRYVDTYAELKKKFRDSDEAHETVQLVIDENAGGIDNCMYVHVSDFTSKSDRYFAASAAACL